MSNQSPVTQVIFDNDGVNIDSEHVAMQVMDDYGYNLVKRYCPDAALKRGEIYEEYPGNSTDKIVKILAKKFDLPINKIIEDYNVPADENYAEFLADLITIETNQKFMTHLEAIPGIQKTLKEIQEAYGEKNLFLCTTSREDRMDISLEYAVDPNTGEKAGLDKVFPKGLSRISGYGCEQQGYESKYHLFLDLHPDCDPAKAVVIEDSLSGVEKAISASPDFRVIGTAAAGFYKDKKAHAKELLDAGACFVVTDIADLPKAIEWASNGFDEDSAPSFKAAVYREGIDITLETERKIDTIPAPQPK